MAATNLFEMAFSKLDNALTMYVVDTSGHLIAYLAPKFTSLLIIYFAIWGYLAMYGHIRDYVGDSFFRLLRIAAVFSLGLTLATYMSVIVNTLQNWPETLAGVVLGKEVNTANVCDELFSRVFTVAKAAWDKGGVMNGNFGLYLLALILLVVGGGLTLYIAFLILLGQFMTTIMLGLGPLVMIGLLFKPTQRFFEQWISAVCNYGFLTILATSVGSLMASIATSYVIAMAPSEDAAANLANLADCSLLCLFFALCILVVRQVPTAAAQLGGGFALSTQGAFGAAMNMLRPTSMQRGMTNVRKELQTTKQAATAPIRGAAQAYQAYQKRFSAGNTVGRRAG